MVKYWKWQIKSQKLIRMHWNANVMGTSLDHWYYHTQRYWKNFKIILGCQTHK